MERGLLGGWGAAYGALVAPHGGSSARLEPWRPALTGCRTRGRARCGCRLLEPQPFAIKTE